MLIKRLRNVIVCYTILVTPAWSVQEVDNADKDIKSSQKEKFIRAENLLKQGNYSEYEKINEELKGYPLQPYLKQQELLQTMSLERAEEIGTFLAKYEHSPLDAPLRKKWLMYLAKREESKVFQKFYRETKDQELKCYHLKYSLKYNDDKNSVYSQVNDVWLTGKSITKVCDPILEEWAGAGYRTSDLILKRVSLAGDGGQHTLIPYLTKLLPEEQKYLGTLWHKVRRDPAYVTKQSKFIKKSDAEKEIYLYGIKRLIWRDPETALKSYKKSQQYFNFTTSEQQEVAEKFVIALTSKKHIEAQNWYEKIDKTKVNKSVLQSKLNGVLARQNWQEIQSELYKMPEHYKAGLQWKYWFARALIENNDKDEGNELMFELAQSRHYYGFLAAGYLDRAVNLQDYPLTIRPVEKNKILEYPSAERAFELYYLERFIEARREWNFWLQQLDEREKLVAAKLANERGWFDRTIFTLSEVGYLNDVELRFPKAFDKKINQYANKQAINPAWAFAITRRESSFMTDAYSSAGAKGLMQIMPNTAKQLKRGSVSRQYLYDADNNIKLGTKYLRKLLDKSEGNQVLATASYNAGPYRVRSWLKDSKSMPADVWIETIPFKETRNYVKSVLAYQEIYQHKPGEVSKVFENVINMNIGG